MTCNTSDIIIATYVIPIIRQIAIRVRHEALRQSLTDDDVEHTQY